MQRPLAASAALLLSLPLLGQTWVARVDRPAMTGGFVGHGPGGLPLMGSGATIHQWDGQVWKARTTLPVAATILELSYDRARDEVVAIALLPPSSGWSAARTFTFDGAAWTSNMPPPQPIGRLQYDPALGAVLALGLDLGSSPTQDWRWDGASWVPLPAGLRPPGLVGATAADTGRGRVVLFPYDFTPYYPDTWEWDGARWQRQAQGPAPPNRRSAAMAYDPLRRRVVLAAGQSAQGTNLNDTWEWDGVTWSQRTSPTRPDPGIQYAMAFDVTRGTMVMFDTARLTETDWEWDGTDWSRLAFRPGPAGDLEVATDRLRGRLVRLHGIAGVTYEWDGNRWMRFASAPPDRVSPLVWDPIGGSVLLFGGRAGVTNPTFLSDTWLWNGSRWSRVNPASSPPARFGHALIGHAASRGVILFGGVDGQGRPLRDTWLWSGGTWTDLTSMLASAPPGGRSLFEAGAEFSSPHLVSGGQLWRWNGRWQMVHPTVPTSRPLALGRDLSSGRPVVVGQQAPGGTLQNGSWEFDGTRWIPGTPPPAILEQMAHDPLRGSLLGFAHGVRHVYTRTPARQAYYGSGCGGPLQLTRGRSLVGATGFRLGAQVAPLAPVLFTLGLQRGSVPLGAGCTALVASPTTVGITTANVSGSADLPLPIPFNTALLGLDVFAQAAALQPGAPLAGLALTAGLRITVGE